MSPPAPGITELVERLEKATGPGRVAWSVLPHRFRAKVAVRRADECWEWQGSTRKPAISALPYGIFYLTKRRRIKAHRLAFLLVHGDIPPGKCVCHTCDNARCCNPRHLWLGTTAENNADRARKGRNNPVRRPRSSASIARGERHGSARLTEAQARAALVDPRPAKAVAEEYGVSHSTICRVRKGKLWPHLLRALPTIEGEER